MALGFNLSHLVSVPALILNANIIPLLVKLHVADEALYKISHISGAPILGGSVNVHP